MYAITLRHLFQTKLYSVLYVTCANSVLSLTKVRLRLPACYHANRSWKLLKCKHMHVMAIAFWKQNFWTKWSLQEFEDSIFSSSLGNVSKALAPISSNSWEFQKYWACYTSSSSPYCRIYFLARLDPQEYPMHSELNLKPSLQGNHVHQIQFFVIVLSVI
jgi:hypothetical protein